MKIRKTKKSDLGGMAKLFVEEYSKPPYNDKWTKKEAINSTKLDIINGESYVAEEGGKIIGFITVTKETAEKIYLFIEDLVVKSDYQGKGIGKKLIEKLEEKYKRKNVVISLSVNKQSLAYKLYKKLGYRENKINVIMSKKLK